MGAKKCLWMFPRIRNFLRKIMRAIILAAGSGIKTKDKHEDIPTCLMEVGGESLLQRQINILKQYDIEEIVVIVGEEGDCWNEKLLLQSRILLTIKSLLIQIMLILQVLVA